MSRMHDKINILKKLTLRRALNLLHLRFSYCLSKIASKPLSLAYPMSLSIEPTTACNLACPECPSGLKKFDRPTGNLQAALNKSILDQVSQHVFYINYYFQGEPFINPNFLEMVRYAKSKRMYTSTSTNAHFLTPESAQKTVESGLDRLIISIDGTTQATYEAYRVNGSLEKVIEGTKAIVEAKRKNKSSTPHLIFQFLVVKPNEHQIEEVHKLANSLGVDEVRFKTAQVYHYENGNPLIPDNESYSRYKKLADGTYRIKNKFYNKCWRMWSSCVITWDGKIVPCCFDKDAQHPMGELKSMMFKDIWKGNTYNRFRSQILNNRSQIEICRNCSEGTKVWT